MILEDLSKKDKIWRSFAFSLTKDKNSADDLVQEMYLKLSKSRKKIKDFYVILTIKSIFYDLKKRKKKLIFVDYNYLSNFGEDRRFELDDDENKVFKEFQKLPFHQKELIIESYSKSLRQIEKEFNINYGYIHREIKKARNKILKNESKTY